MTRGELTNAINELYKRIDGCAVRMDREAGRCSRWPGVQSETDERIAAEFDELRSLEAQCAELEARLRALPPPPVRPGPRAGSLAERFGW